MAIMTGLDLDGVLHPWAGLQSPADQVMDKPSSTFATVVWHATPKLENDPTGIFKTIQGHSNAWFGHCGCCLVRTTSATMDWWTTIETAVRWILL